MLSGGYLPGSQPPIGSLPPAYPAGAADAGETAQQRAEAKAKAKPPPGTEGPMLPLEFLVATDAVFTRGYVVYTLLALAGKKVALLFPTDAFVAELCWLGTLAWLQYVRLRAGELGNHAHQGRAGAIFVFATWPVLLAQGFFFRHQTYQLHGEAVVYLVAGVLSLLESLLGMAIALTSRRPVDLALAALGLGGVVGVVITLAFIESTALTAPGWLMALLGSIFALFGGLAHLQTLAAWQ